MDRFVHAETLGGDAYIKCLSGDVWRIYFGNDGLPLIERLTPQQIGALDDVKRQMRYDKDVELRRASSQFP